MNVSVVMAVCNGERHLRAAVESVLAQTVQPLEFLIVDDASTDDTPDILADYARRDRRIRVLRNVSRLGPYPSANAGFSAARGDVIARHDADDVSPRDRLAVQLDAFRLDETSLVAGTVELFDERERNRNAIIRPPQWQPRLEWELLFTNVIGAGGQVMFPRTIRGTPVLFPCRHVYAEDYALWCRLARLGRVASPSEIVYRYRQHEGSITSRLKAEQDECLADIRRDYQSECRRRPLSREATDRIAQFWQVAGSVPAGARLDQAEEAFRDLRDDFLGYVGKRYGSADRAALAAELDADLANCLGQWLYVSMKRGNARASRDVLSLARRGRRTGIVIRRAWSELGAALARKTSRRGGTAS